jgi:diguanylate cyclase (GGDEF)-like protein
MSTSTLPEAQVPQNGMGGGVTVLPNWSTSARRPKRRPREDVEDSVAPEQPGVEAASADAVPEPEAVSAAIPRQPAAPRPTGRRASDLGPVRPLAVVDRAGMLKQIAAALPPTAPLAVVQVGVDNFRHINAGIGPASGDAVLERVSAALSSTFAPHQVFRVEGDSFAVLIPYEGLPSAIEWAERALELIASMDLSADGSGVRATASAGLTVLDRPGLTPEGLLLEADLAMIAAKRSGRNRCSVHHPQEASTATAVHDWATQIRQALETDSFVLHAQPVKALRNQVDQWELLVRLPAGTGELLPPNDFLPVAERFGLMQQVDELVTSHAVHMIAANAAQGRTIRLEVNIAGSTLASQSFVTSVEQAITSTGIDPSCLVFEVNGSTLEAKLDEVRVFSERLRSLGCKFAVDHFGRNDGALEQFKMLPLDFVKIDGSFVRHLATSTVDQHIVAGLTHLAHSLGCEVIATAVSDDESSALLDQMGVDYLQGFHVGRPVGQGEQT